MSESPTQPLTNPSPEDTQDHVQGQCLNCYRITTLVSQIKPGTTSTGHSVWTGLCENCTIARDAVRAFLGVYDE